MSACFCNAAGRHKCCVGNCETPNVHPHCMPCHLYRGTETRCLQTDETKEQRATHKY